MERALDVESRVRVLNPQPATQPRQPHAEPLHSSHFQFPHRKNGVTSLSRHKDLVKWCMWWLTRGTGFPSCSVNPLQPRCHVGVTSPQLLFSNSIWTTRALAAANSLCGAHIIVRIMRVVLLMPSHQPSRSLCE